MLQSRNLESVDLVFPFLAGFVDRCTGCMQPVPMTRVPKLYTKPENKLTKYWNGEETS